MLRVGLLGTGDAGRHHARALARAQTEGRLAWTAIGARDIAAIERQRTELGATAATRILAGDELLAGGACDAVIIATPDGMHADHALRALRAGMHVLVEKPLALAVADAVALVGEAGARGRVLQVGYQLRHHAGHELVHDQLAQLVGRVRSIGVHWAWPDPAVAGWRASGQDAKWWSLAALGTHALDLALWLADTHVTETACLREPPTGIDHAAVVALRFASGLLGHVSVAITHRSQSSLVIAGDAGEVEATGTLGARGAGTLVHRANRESRELAFTVEDPYLRQLRAFVARCAGGEPRIDEHAVENVALLHRL